VGDTRVIIVLRQKASLLAWEPREVGRALFEHAQRTQVPLRSFLSGIGAKELVGLPILNGLAATVPSDSLALIAAYPGVEAVLPDRPYTAPGIIRSSSVPTAWNLSAVGAPRMWLRGFSGAGVVVANMDTGVDLRHVDLQAGWRGGTNSWFDPFQGTPVPNDPIGHGTQTMGIMVGGDASGAALGVAPQARWIAAKIYDDSGNSSASVIHQAFQWLLDPDQDPNTSDAPQVVNASWGDDLAGSCDTTFQADIDALKAAGVLVVFSAGNSGPYDASDVSPANNPGAFSAGAVDETRAVASFSSRGPSACTGGLFPDVVAPGVDVRTTDLTFAGAPEYISVSGTSYAAPHVAGAAALLLSALPRLTVSQLQEALRGSATDLADAGADDTHGFGLVNAAEAYATLMGERPLGIDTWGLADAPTGVAYRQRVHAHGGLEPYSWSLLNGSLPDGLQLDAASGTLAGVPRREGWFHFTVGARDEMGHQATRSLSLWVWPWPRLLFGGLFHGQAGAR
jgi:bacillopeptidase F